MMASDLGNCKLKKYLKPDLKYGKHGDERLLKDWWKIDERLLVLFLSEIIAYREKMEDYS